VRTSIIGRPRRLSKDRRAIPNYTVIWEEPVNVGVVSGSTTAYSFYTTTTYSVYTQFERHLLAYAAVFVGTDRSELRGLRVVSVDDNQFSVALRIRSSPGWIRGPGIVAQPSIFVMRSKHEAQLDSSFQHVWH